MCICYELPFLISSVSIYYRTQSDILVKIYCRLHLIGASIFNLERHNILWDYVGHLSKKLLSLVLSVSFRVFNYERLDILRYSTGHPCINLLSFEFATSFHFQFGASRYIMGLNQTSELKVIAV